jgi:hypothetical protein
MVSTTCRVPPHSNTGKGSPQALSSLLRASAHQALLYAISRFGPSDPAPLCAAFARALRALTVSLAELVGPHHWGLPPDYSKSSVRSDAKNALDLIFQVSPVLFASWLVDSRAYTRPILSTSIYPSSCLPCPLLHPPRHHAFQLASAPPLLNCSPPASVQTLTDPPSQNGCLRPNVQRSCGQTAAEGGKKHLQWAPIRRRNTGDGWRWR